MNILILMAGSDEAFRTAGYTYPKNFIEIASKPLIQLVIESMEPLISQAAKKFFCIRHAENRSYFTGSAIRLLIPDAEIVDIPQETAGAACTALLAVEHISNDEPLVIINGDQIIKGNILPAIQGFQKDGADGGIIVFDAIHPRWSYVRCDRDGYVVETAEKRPISRMATAGVYYFARGKDFVEAAFSMILKQASIEGRYYVCPAYNELILKQMKIKISNIEANSYISLASPQGVARFEETLVTRRGGH